MGRSTAEIPWITPFDAELSGLSIVAEFNPEVKITPLLFTSKDAPSRRVWIVLVFRSLAETTLFDALRPSVI
jgi:hypothetical protein